MKYKNWVFIATFFIFFEIIRINEEDGGEKTGCAKQQWV